MRFGRELVAGKPECEHEWADVPGYPCVQCMKCLEVRAVVVAEDLRRIEEAVDQAWERFKP